MNCGEEEAGERKGCLVSKCAALTAVLYITVCHLTLALRSKPAGTVLFQMQKKKKSLSAITSWRAMKQWSAALQFVSKMTKSRKYKQGKVGDLSQRHWMIPLLLGA